MPGAVPEHPGVDERLQLRRELANHFIQGGDIALARLVELRNIFSRRGNFELTFHTPKPTIAFWILVAEKYSDRMRR